MEEDGDGAARGRDDSLDGSLDRARRGIGCQDRPIGLGSRIKQDELTSVVRGQDPLPASQEGDGDQTGFRSQLLRLSGSFKRPDVNVLIANKQGQTLRIIGE